MPGPCAVDDAISTAYETAVVSPVLANDKDRSSTGLTVTAVTAPAHGTVVLNADNTITYTPLAGFSGTDEFEYTVQDGLGIEAVASVVVTVAAPGEQKVLFMPLLVK